jgi:hypothetical protein
MSTKTLPRALALTLALGTTAAATLTPAHATNGRTVAQECVDRDDCSIQILPGDDGAFTVTFDGGGIIYCPSVNDECVVVSPDKGNGGRPAPVATPITKTPGPNAGPTGGRPVSNNPKPVTNNPRPVSSNPKPPKGTTGTVGFHPIPHPIFKPIGTAAGGKSGAPVLLARGGHR